MLCVPDHVCPFVALDDKAVPEPLVYVTLFPYSQKLPFPYFAVSGLYPVISFTSSTVILVAFSAPFPCPNIPLILFNSSIPFIYPFCPVNA